MKKIITILIIMLTALISHAATNTLGAVGETVNIVPIITFSGGWRGAIETLTSGTIANATTFVICDSTGGNRTLSLPDLATNRGHQIIIQKNDSTNSCSIQRSGSDTIMLSGTGTGQTTFNLVTNAGSVMCFGGSVDSSEWFCGAL